MRRDVVCDRPVYFPIRVNLCYPWLGSPLSISLTASGDSGCKNTFTSINSPT